MCNDRGIPAAIRLLTNILQLNCESDFVARNSIFQNLSARIVESALLLQEIDEDNSKQISAIDLESLMEKPLLPHPTTLEFEKPLSSSASEQNAETVCSGITDTIGKLGENIKLKRAIFVSQSSLIRPSPTIIGSFVHGSAMSYPVRSWLCLCLFNSKVSPSSNLRVRLGKMGPIVLLEMTSSNAPFDDSKFSAEISTFADQVAQHVTGMNPSAEELLTQPYLFDQEKSLKEALDAKAIEFKLESLVITDFARFYIA